MRPDQKDLDHYNAAHDIADAVQAAYPKIKDFIEQECLKQFKSNAINPQEQARRIYDGMSQNAWLFEKMIADLLYEDKIKL